MDRERERERERVVIRFFLMQLSQVRWSVRRDVARLTSASCSAAWSRASTPGLGSWKLGRHREYKRGSMVLALRPHMKDLVIYLAQY